jgi:hypothetical protein
LKPNNRPQWHSDGPELAIEFARHSARDRITLVTVPPDSADPIPVLWAYMDCPDIGAAQTALARRELDNDNPSQAWTDRNIATWAKGAVPSSATAQKIATWASAKRLDGAVWTALPPKFGGQERVPTRDEVIRFLEQLQKSKRQAAAEEYIRNAPPKIQTKYRAAIESQFGWTCNRSATQAEII